MSVKYRTELNDMGENYVRTSPCDRKEETKSVANLEFERAVCSKKQYPYCTKERPWELPAPPPKDMKLVRKLS